MELSKIYYSPRGYWKGLTAVKKLASAAKVPEDVAKDWLKKQAIWQIYLLAPRRIPRPKFDVGTPNEVHQADLLFLPHDLIGRKTYKYAKDWLKKQAIWQIYLLAPRRIPRPKFDVGTPNEVHQADLLFLPHDLIGRKTYKYALILVDVASRYKEAEPLASKEATEVAAALARIYRRGPLRWPKLLQVDPGREEGVSKTLLGCPRPPCWPSGAEASFGGWRPLSVPARRVRRRPAPGD
ncbi:LOW QUALITY PROTEIN: hypothetical protein ElyMa_005539700 [Elysia marginata]|uniref:Integrase catalytic domain-containing protein n=1 Tax=Elysia marginata TaxID=1093978 RepID=A0AAV4EXE6_9GAST|nr:LOW QUALITY PROTEIN: hypothetical protein ElyMa_005539700 [Elysia marginata]